MKSTKLRLVRSVDMRPVAAGEARPRSCTQQITDPTNATDSGYGKIEISERLNPKMSFIGYIGIFDAAGYDVKDDGQKFDISLLQKERTLSSNDPDPLLRDPVATNRLYRDLRNIRTHQGKTMVEVNTTMQLADIGKRRATGLPRWYVTDLERLDYSNLRTRYLSEFEIRKFAEFYRRTPLVSLLSQSLVAMVFLLNDLKPQK